jgi:hypothetical protein
MKLHRAKSWLATAVAAGTACAFAATGAAMAAPTSGWTGGGKPVPSVFTNATPGLATFYETGQNVAGTFLAFKGQLDNNVKYKFQLNGKWSKGVGTIPGAHTTTSPAAAFYTNSLGKASELVVWKRLHSNKIFYSTGQISAGGSISWTKPAQLPGGSYATTSAAPAVFFPLNTFRARVIVAWRGPFDHVRYELGSPSGRAIKWTGKSEWIGKGSATNPTTTSAGPALTEILSNGGATGTIYVFWKDKPGSAVSYASVPDNAATGLAGGNSLSWTLLGKVPGSFSTAAPAVSSIDAHGDGPLLLAYKGPRGEHIRYQILGTSGWSGVAYVTGANSNTNLGPALVNGTLANVSPTNSARVYLHHYVG